MSSPRSRVPAALSLLLAASVGVASPTSYADEPTATEPTAAPASVSVTFPERTRLVDPVGAPYVVHVDAPEGSTVSSSWLGYGPSVSQPGPGEFAIDFGSNGRAPVRVTVCPPAEPCQVAESPVLEVTRVLEAATGGSIGPATESVRMSVTGLWAGDVVDVRWSLVDAAGTVLAQEQHQDVPAVGEHPFSSLDVPVAAGRDLPEGSYGWEAELVLEGPDGTTVRGSGRWPITWDASNALELRVHGEVVYPARDRYKDSEDLTAIVRPDVDQVRFEAVAEDGRVVWSKAPRVRSGRADVAFAGRDEDGIALPAGTYTMRATALDHAGNLAVDEGSLELRDGELTMVTWEGSLTAARAAGGRTVGPCSTLASPAPGRGKGSLGYYSQTRCSRSRDSVVSSSGGIVVPRSLTGRYAAVKVWLTAGAARGPAYDYLVTYVYTGGNRANLKSEQTGGWRRRLVAEGGAELVAGRTGAQPHVSWFWGLQDGSRFDVGSVDVRLRYETLR